MKDFQIKAIFEGTYNQVFAVNSTWTPHVLLDGIKYSSADFHVRERLRAKCFLGIDRALEWFLHLGSLLPTGSDDADLARNFSIPLRQPERFRAFYYKDSSLGSVFERTMFGGSPFHHLHLFLSAANTLVLPSHNSDEGDGDIVPTRDGDCKYSTISGCVSMEFRNDTQLYAARHCMKQAGVPPTRLPSKKDDRAACLVGLEPSLVVEAMKDGLFD